jgi:CubicO group peptidase (beta-lactamase class C family)
MVLDARVRADASWRRAWGELMINRRFFMSGGLAAGAALACTGRPAFAQSQELKQAIRKALERASVPGVSYAIIQDNVVAEQGVVGVGRADKQTRLETTSRFQAASLSKTINALCVLTLVRDGLVGLDDPVNEHLKDWKLGGRADSGKVTIRMLLSHSGGVNVHGFAGYSLGQRLPSTQQILSGAAPANSEPVSAVSRPGRAFKYSGGGITVLQKMVTDVTGSAYHLAVHQRVLSPLAMQNSSIMQPPGSSGELSFGHDSAGTTYGWNIYPEMAAAGLWTTPGDMARAVIAIIQSINSAPGALLPSELGKQINKPAFQGAGLGVFVDGGGRINHSGVNAGFRAVYVASPKRKRGYVVMSNGENGEALNDKVARLLMDAQGWRSV